ncbi:MAG: ACT domain-containing protein [Pseudomonadales bacterium]|nr:ACT domain-containing protein [Pseudomonadales bacterium]
MVSGMAPVLEAGRYLFTALDCWPSAQEAGPLLGVFREEEGLTAYRRLGPEEVLPPGGVAMVKITLQVYSDLEGVGLTAAVATTLAEEGIPCNVVAALHHDHLFVPETQGAAALRCLEALAQAAKDA